LPLILIKTSLKERAHENLPRADMISTISEPLWMTFNCKLNLEALMELADL
jgi:hypothetical protein